ncbi:hypothetical protein [Hyphomicrobium sp. CS1GBMeth3]|uniref:hypothetical protein n=1 Tax=Hyphomicrobium sp. CS1GBMeth3 TaxID=1892845 RepID=UPI000A7FD1A3|nr:hypothetical protein [Hyphomicrobium sp. CS1GBMeth3]
MARALPGAVRPSPIHALLALDLIAISAFLALHLAGRSTGHRAQWLMLNVDHSLPEFLLYGKWLAVALLLVWAFRRDSGAVWVALAVTFLVILADDAFRIHEREGLALAERWELSAAFGLRARDIGELLVWAALGLIVLASIAAGLWRSTPEQRKAARPLLLTLVALVVAGVGVDMLHSAVSGALLGHPLKQPVAVLMILLEDGSELLLGTLAVWLAMRRAGLENGSGYGMPATPTALAKVR